jgi:DNA-binding LacI/PurR family transcriptional regulator
MACTRHATRAFARHCTTQGSRTTALLTASPDPTAIFATNDLPALGAMHAAADLGLNIPRDLSIIGITNIQLARESRPALSAVAVPTEVAATMTVKLLHALIDGSAVRKRYP